MGVKNYTASVFQEVIQERFKKNLKGQHSHTKGVMYIEQAARGNNRDGYNSRWVDLEGCGQGAGKWDSLS